MIAEKKKWTRRQHAYASAAHAPAQLAKSPSERIYKEVLPVAIASSESLC
jgi:hypothetical protein